MKTYNPIIDLFTAQADSYKLSHFQQYPEGSEFVYSYIEPRKGAGIPVLGIRDFIEWLDDFSGCMDPHLLKEFCKNHGVPFNEGWFDLYDNYGGRLPVAVFGVPEGTVVDGGTPVAAIVNTDPKYPWLTSFLETLFLRCVWYPSTVAARSRYCRLRIKEFMERTGADMSGLPFKLHDFGSRGASSSETAAIGGAGHLTQFKGTDTLAAIYHITETYKTSEIPGFSIPATEHSTVTSWGRDGEFDMYDAYIKNASSSVIACVMDSYDIDAAIEHIATKHELLKEKNITFVVRPDSGDPVTTPAYVIGKLMDLVGYTRNEKGFKVLPPEYRVIQGDGITEDTLVRIMQLLVDKKISLDNIAFGMGGGLLQKCDRDTYSWAMKCSAIRVNGEWRDVYKDPKAGGKTSKKGIVAPHGTVPYEDVDLMIHSATAWEGYVCYYRDGVLGDELETTWETVCNRAQQ